MLDTTKRQGAWPGEGEDPLLLGRIALEWGLIEEGEFEALLAECDRLRAAGRDASLGRLLAGRGGIDAGALSALAREARARSGEAPAELVRLERYAILETIGRGGMGRVVRARDEELGRVVALKILERGLDDDRGRKRFLREARAVARLSHPNVVSVHDVGEAQGRPFLVMELVAGGSLDRRLAQPIDLDEMVALLAKVARGVHAAHEAGIVHRDLKPGNILLTPEGEPKVADFGLALVREKDSLVTRTGAILGTPLYMAPEQFDESGREVDRRADVYALGAIIYEVLTGTTPHRGSSAMDQCYRVLNHEPVPPRRLDRSVPWQLEAIALKALARRPEDRYPTAADLAEDLERHLRDEPIEARRVTVLRRLRLWARRRRALLATAWLASMAVLATMVWALWLRPRLEASARRERLEALEAAARGLVEVEEERLADADPRIVLDEAVPERVAEMVLGALEPGDEAERDAIRRGLAGYRPGPLLARAHFELGHWATAYRYDPEGPLGVRARIEIAGRLAGLDRHAEAAEILRRVYARSGDEAALVPLADALLETGDLGAAHAAMAKAGSKGTRARLVEAFALELQSLPIPGREALPSRAQRERLRILDLGRPTLVLFHRAGRPAFEVGTDGGLEPVASPLEALEDSDAIVDLQTADVDGDGVRELVAAIERAGGGWGFALLARREGEWRLEALELGGQAPLEALAVGDLDRDGADEAVVLFSHESGAHWVVDFPGPRVLRVRPEGPRPWAFAPLAGDFDGDGRPELLLGRSNEFEAEAQIYVPPIGERPSPAARFRIGRLVDSLLVEPGRIAFLCDALAGDEDGFGILSFREGRLELLARHGLGSDAVELGTLSTGRLLGRPVVAGATDGRRLGILFLDDPASPPVPIGVPAGTAALSDLDGDGESELLLASSDRLSVRGRAREVQALAGPAAEEAALSEPKLLLEAARELSSLGAHAEAEDLLAEVARRFEGTGEGAEALRRRVETFLESADLERREAYRLIGERRFDEGEALWARALETCRVAAEEARDAASRLADRPSARRAVLMAGAEACRWRLDWPGMRDLWTEARKAAPGFDAPDPGPAARLLALGETAPLLDGRAADASRPVVVDFPARARIGEDLVAVFDSYSARHVLGVPIEFTGGAFEWEIEFAIEGSVWAANLHVGLVPRDSSVSPCGSAGAVSLTDRRGQDWDHGGVLFEEPGLAGVHTDRFAGRWAIEYSWFPEVRLVRLEIRDLEDPAGLVCRQWAEPGEREIQPGRYVLGFSIGETGISDAYLGSGFHPTATHVSLGAIRFRSEPGRARIDGSIPRSARDLHLAAGAQILLGKGEEARGLYREALERDPGIHRARVHLALAGGTDEEFLKALDFDPYGYVLAVDDALRGAPESARLAIGERLRAGIERHPGPALSLLGDLDLAAGHLTSDDPVSRYLRHRGKIGGQDRWLGDWRWLSLQGLRPAGSDPPDVYWAPGPGESAATAREALRRAQAAEDLPAIWVAASRLLLLEPDDPEGRIARANFARAYGRAGLAEWDLRRLAESRPDDPRARLNLALHFAFVRARRETLRFLEEAIARGLDPAVLDEPTCRQAFSFLEGDPRFEEWRRGPR